jgi:meso-butanediol dehydrogenase/(S,S)-butanediol dehydrogenase/diacetyl reductase
MHRFRDQAAVVTGGGHGIGRASALRLAQEGARVAIVDVRAPAAEETASLIRDAGGVAIAVSADVSDEQQVEASVREIVDEFGRIDLLHSNAGVIFAGTALTQSVDEWDRTFAVNVKSMFLMARAVIPIMREHDGGAIVNTGSTSGIVGEPNLVAYNSSKAAVVNLTRQLAADFSRDGIRVNCVCPGWIVHTDFNNPVLKDLSPEEIDGLIDQSVPMGRSGKADEIAAAVAFLLSDDASYVAGHALLVDGGMTAL